MKPKTILVAEGEPQIRDVYRAGLEREGYRVVCASRVDEVLEKIRREHPDLVVLDMGIPAEGGLETLCQIVREHESLPVILTSRYELCNEGFLIWLAEAWILKSADLSELKRAIERVFSTEVARADRKKGGFRAGTEGYNWPHARGRHAPSTASPEYHGGARPRA